MKESLYNIWINHEEENLVLLFNSYTSALIEMNEEEAKLFKSSYFDKLSKEDVKALEESGFLIDDGYDENKELRYQVNKSRFDTSRLSVTIAPYSGCNFRCTYCFERNRLDNAEKMSLKTADAVIENLKKMLLDSKYLKIHWFGGEPTMALDIVEYISQPLIKFCKKHEKGYDATIVTNGYLIDEKFGDFCLRNKISTVQITVDGDKKFHDCRRLLTNGSGTYDQIISNIVKYGHELSTIGIRVNVDKNNEDAPIELKEKLKSLNALDNVFISLGKVFVDDTSEYSSELCYKDAEFAELLYDSATKGVGQAMHTDLPTQVINACGASCESNFVVNADGALYKCWNEIGEKEYSFGNIRNGYRVHGSALDYVNYDVFEDPVCKNCKFIPICMGSCISRKQLKKDCCVEKFLLDKIVKNYTMSKRKGQSNE